MHPDRVTALLDLSTRSPELSREVKGIWWSVGVEEYRVPYSSSQIESEADVLKGCANLEELRLGEDVRVITSGGDLERAVFDEETKPRASPRMVRPYALYLSKSSPGSDASALFEPQWVGFKSSSCSIIEHSENRTLTIISTPPLDLSKLRGLSCHYPSSEFSALTRNLSQKDLKIECDLKEVALQVSDFGMLVDELSTESSSLLRLFDGRSFDRLSLAVTLPSSYTPRASGPNTPTTAVPSLSMMNVTRPAPPLTVSDRVTKLLTFLTSHRPARAISVEFKTSIEQGADILLNGLDLEPIARRLSSESPTSGFLRSSSIDVHFSLSPGCYTSYSYAENPDMNVEDFGEGLSKERVERSYRSAVDMLCGAGVKLDVGYDVVGYEKFIKTGGVERWFGRTGPGHLLAFGEEASAHHRSSHLPLFLPIVTKYARRLRHINVALINPRHIEIFRRGFPYGIFDNLESVSISCPLEMTPSQLQAFLQLDTPFNTAPKLKHASLTLRTASPLKFIIPWSQLSSVEIDDMLNPLKVDQWQALFKECTNLQYGTLVIPTNKRERRRKPLEVMEHQALTRLRFLVGDSVYVQADWQILSLPVQFPNLRHLEFEFTDTESFSPPRMLLKPFTRSPGLSNIESLTFYAPELHHIPPDIGRIVEQLQVRERVVLPSLTHITLPYLNSRLDDIALMLLQRPPTANRPGLTASLGVDIALRD
ncbi:hypothetical protein EST38_g3690 [Candolleomyces aberdarensis]|uniref:Uncharacterized protein n=1 Tax=Candolleomyces aberdarensis TaxID=2316362 RepID=A0A4Q2DPA3_9AGAR|nr:hypothetical protein EST38_g3690 [Candolleomyces aberdarensis]